MKPQNITIDDARKRLGKRGEQMTDQDILNLLGILRNLCNKAIDSACEDL